MATVDVQVIEVEQNIWKFYVGPVVAADLFQIAGADRIRLTNLEIPKYAGFQRALVPERVNQIRDYLKTPGSTFPNAVILSIDSEFIDDWPETKGLSGLSTMKIRREKGAAVIIDGQHRVAALDAADPSFQVIVSIFVDLPVVRQAEIFAKINSTQKAVNPSIAYQLFGYSEHRSPQKTAHEIAHILNSTKGTPFYKRLRMLGTKDEWAAGSLSQATFAKELMRLYSRDPLADQNRLLRGEPLEEYTGYPLRGSFTRREDRKILEIVWRYFFHVAETWPDQWSDPTGTSILTKTTGYAAFIRVLRVWLSGERAQEPLTDQGVREALHNMRERYTEPQKRFLRSNYPAGNQGVITLRDSLMVDLDLR